MKNFFLNTLKRYVPIHPLSLCILLGMTIATTQPTFAQQTLCQQIGGNFVPQITVGQNQFSITFTSNLGTAIWQNKKVLINGTLVVNSNFQIASCSLKMGSNAVIRVDPNITFNSTYSKYFHCGNDFWTGFVFMGGTNGIWFNHIEDASIALDIRTSAANVVVAGNMINRNNKGIYAQNIAVNAVVAANTFDCSSILNTLAIGFAGVDFNSCPSASIGLSLAQPGLRNTFKNLTHGINLYNTTVNVGLSTFERNNRGVTADYSVLTVRGADASETTKFIFNEADVYTTHSNLDLFYCFMDSCEYSNIRSLKNNNLEQVHIYDNTINITKDPLYPWIPKMGISLDRSRFGNDNMFRNTIDRNHITIQDFYGSDRRAIHVRGSFATHDYMRIDLNTIDVKTGGNSIVPAKFVDIDISSAEHFNISRNSILSSNTFAQGSSRWGFFLVNGATNPAEGNRFSDNSILGIGPDDGCCALHAENAGPWGICGNTTDETYRGFHFMGNCGESKFGGNEINNHNFDPLNQYVGGTGLLIQGLGGDNGFLGDQTCQNNHWAITDYSIANAYTAIVLGNGVAAPSQGTVGKNEFYVPSLSDAHQAPIDRNPMENWFRETSCLEAAEDCSAPDLNRFDENDEWVRTNYTTPQPAPDVEEWQSTRYVMAKLLRYPNLAVGNVLTFRNAYNQSSAGLFARFDSMMNAISNVTAASQFQLNTLDADIQAKQAEIGDLDGTISDFMLVDARLLATRATLLAEAAVLSDRRSLLRAQNAAAREPLLTECTKFNFSLPANQVYEQNQKLINALTIQLMRGIDLSQADKDTLHSIAEQCYNVAGRTKSAAASLLPPEESTQYYHENPEDYNCPQREAAHQHQHPSAQLLLAPNPASNVLQIQFEKPFVGDLMISDRAGKRIQTFRLNESAKNVDISVATLINGLYFLSGVDAEGNAIANTKFVVIH